MDLQVAEGEYEDAGAELKTVSEGEGALTVEEVQSVLLRAQKKAERLKLEYEHLRPLLDKGYITRDELAKTEDQLEDAEQELVLARRRTSVVIELSHPREQKRAALALAQIRLPDLAANAPEEFRQLGLTGEWADRPIQTFGHAPSRPRACAMWMPQTPDCAAGVSLCGAAISGMGSAGKPV